MRILFVKLGAIGDIVHALPALADARRAFPDGIIDWVVETRSAEILRNNPALDSLAEIDTRSIRRLRSPERIASEIRRQILPLRENSYDVAVDLQGLLKSALVAKVSRAEQRWGFDIAGLKESAAGVFYTHRGPTTPGQNVIAKNRGLISQALGTIPTPDLLEFPIGTSAEHRKEADRIVDAAGGNFALINPAGGWETKLWPAENFGRLAARISQELGMTPVVAVGPHDLDLAERVRSSVEGAPLVVCQPSLKGLYELARRARIYVGGDTGPTHIAVAAGTPVVGIFGPTEWWRNGSPREEDIGIGREDIACRINCHRRTCSKWICMEISVESVFEALVNRLATAEQSTAREAFV